MPTIPRRLLRCSALLAAALLSLALSGCPQPADKPAEGPETPSLAGTKLELLVVDDSALADAVRRLQGEWELQSGSQLTVRQATAAKLAAAGAVQADAAIVSDGELGALAEAGKIVPLPADLVESPAAGWNGIFDLVRSRAVVWGDEVYAAPLGSPQWVCYYRADLLEALDCQPPATWSEYQEIAELLANRENLGDALRRNAAWSAAAEPLAPGWAGLVFLSRAACYAKHRENYSTLFDMGTMEPLIAGPPFVRALEELVAAAKLRAPEQLEADPVTVRQRFWRGECGLAITWPSAADKVPGELPRGMVPAIAPLPGSREVFRSQEGTWEKRADDEPTSVPLLALSGRLGVVAAGSPNPQAAAQLLLWLSSEERSSQVARVSPATTLFRRAQIGQSGQWVEKGMPSSMAARYGEIVAEACRTEQWFDAPRIPGRAEYLAALDAAVRRAVLGEQSPADALTAAAAEWRAITERLGRDAQRTAYLHSLGLSP